MTFAYPNQGTCSRMTKIELAPDHTIESIEVMGGCNGNLKGIASLLKGMKAEDAIARMEGVTCGPKPTSCPRPDRPEPEKGPGRDGKPVNDTKNRRPLSYTDGGRFFALHRPGKCTFPSGGGKAGRTLETIAVK